MIHNSRTCPWPPSLPRKGSYVDFPNGVTARKGDRNTLVLGLGSSLGVCLSNEKRIH